MKKTQPKIRDVEENLFISWWRGVRLGLANFWRNKFLSMATVVVIAVILFIFNIILAVQMIGNQALQGLSERVDIVVNLRDDISFYDAQNLSTALEKIDGVKKVHYTSKEEALERVAKIHPQTAEFIRKFNIPNPLLPSISIVTTSPEDYQKIENFLKQEPYKQLTQNYVIEGASNESLILSDVARNLANISHFVRQIIFWIILVFILGGALVVINAIQLTIYTRRHEIYIMRLVGATPGFIRLPFLFEGILYGFFAVLLSFLILFVLSQNIQVEGSNLWSYYQNIQLGKIFLAELIITLSIGIISSFSATEQYLKGKLTVN